jgi:hypothetical protein
MENIPYTNKRKTDNIAYTGISSTQYSSHSLINVWSYGYWQDCVSRTDTVNCTPMPCNMVTQWCDCHYTLLNPYGHGWITGDRQAQHLQGSWCGAHIRVFMCFVWCLYCAVRTIFWILFRSVSSSRVKTRQAISSAIALYGCETWSLTLRE